MKSRLVRTILAVICLVSSGLAWADSWALPTTATYLSADQRFRLVVIPRQLDSELAYFEDKVGGKEPAGGAAGAKQASAQARLERFDGQVWTSVWDRPFTNDVAPVDALVSNDGQRVVTFDNWSSVGFGKNVLVIYDGSGAMLRSFALEELLPEPYALAMDRSVSSRDWRRGIEIAPDSRTLVIKVAIPGEKSTIDLTVDLENAAPLPLEGPAWLAAMKAATRRLEEQRKAEAERMVFLRSPLLPPASSREQDWHAYLREAYMRLAEETLDDQSPASATVLRLSNVKDYGTSVKWLVQALNNRALDTDWDNPVIIGSPDQTNLVLTIEKLGPKLKKGAMSGQRIYVVVDDANRDRVGRALARTGGQFVQVDPLRPIPQRPERIADFDERLREAEARRR